MGAAQLRYCRLELNCGEPSWWRFTNHVHMCFGPSMIDSPLGEIVSL